MISQHDELLDPITWLGQVRRLVDGVHADPSCPERHIRKAYHLVCLAPEPLSRAFPDPIEEDALEAMLADEKYESAALRVVGPKFAVAKTAPCPRGDRSLAILAACAENVLQLETQPG